MPCAERVLSVGHDARRGARTVHPSCPCAILCGPRRNMPHAWRQVATCRRSRVCTPCQGTHHQSVPACFPTPRPTHLHKVDGAVPALPQLLLRCAVFKPVLLQELQVLRSTRTAVPDQEWPGTCTWLCGALPPPAQNKTAPFTPLLPRDPGPREPGSRGEASQDMSCWCWLLPPSPATRWKLHGRPHRAAPRHGGIGSRPHNGCPSCRRSTPRPIRFRLSTHSANSPQAQRPTCARRRVAAV